MIPEAAVEAAAIAVYGAECADLWADEDPKVKASYLEDVRTTLEAAAPHMLAAGWSTCSVEAARCGLLSPADALLLANRNTYRGQA